MAEKLRFSSVNMGGNWWRIVNWAADEFRRLGYECEVTRYGQERDSMMTRLANKEADICCSLTCLATMAARGQKPWYSEIDMGVRGLALMLHPGHNFFHLVTKESGITSFADIAKKKPKLRLCISAADLGKGMVSAITKEYGFTMEDVEAWGGEFHTRYEQAGTLVLEGKADGIMRENTRNGPAAQAASGRDMVMLDVDPAIIKKVAPEYGMSHVVIPKGTLRGQDRDINTVGNSGYPLIVDKSMDEGLAYRLAKAIDRDFQRHYATEDIFYAPKHAPETGCPLHPGAERYYREAGLLK
jgi:TRAP transporter TAXI family solute receptor